MADSVETPACGACQYFVLDGRTNGSGRCQRRAPVADHRKRAVWPHVWTDYWCGEFEPRQHVAGRSGGGAGLTPGEVDENFSALDDRIDALEEV